MDRQQVLRVQLELVQRVRYRMDRQQVQVPLVLVQPVQQALAHYQMDRQQARLVQLALVLQVHYQMDQQLVQRVRQVLVPHYQTDQQQAQLVRLVSVLVPPEPELLALP